jgi:hypothetical protein
MTTPTTTPKLHDLTEIRGTIKRLAHEARDLRRQARETFGPARWQLKHEANELAHSARYNLLAYGYLRGLTIEQMESPHTINHASASTILDIAGDAFYKAVETPEGQPPIEGVEAEHEAWQDFKAHVETDVKQWNAACHLRVLQRDAEQAVKAVA